VKREHKAPKEKLEAGARALRLIHSDIVDIDLREQQLARMLAPVISDKLASPCQGSAICGN
jgi:hypothetical protein